MTLIAIEDGVVIEYASGNRVTIHFGGYGLTVLSSKAMTYTTEKDGAYLQYAEPEVFETRHSGIWINADECDEEEVETYLSDWKND